MITILTVHKINIKPKDPSILRRNGTGGFRGGPQGGLLLLKFKNIYIYKTCRKPESFQGPIGGLKAALRPPVTSNSLPLFSRDPGSATE